MEIGEGTCLLVKAVKIMSCTSRVCKCWIPSLGRGLWIARSPWISWWAIGRCLEVSARHCHTLRPFRCSYTIDKHNFQFCLKSSLIAKRLSRQAPLECPSAENAVINKVATESCNPYLKYTCSKACKYQQLPHLEMLVFAYCTAKRWGSVAPVLCFQDFASDILYSCFCGRAQTRAFRCIKQKQGRWSGAAHSACKLAYFCMKSFWNDKSSQNQVRSLHV